MPLVLCRSSPSSCLPAPFTSVRPQPLSKPQVAWHFDFLNPPDSSAFKYLDFEMHQSGNINAVMSWCELHLWQGITLGTGLPPQASGAAAHTCCGCSSDIPRNPLGCESADVQCCTSLAGKALTVQGHAAMQARAATEEVKPEPCTTAAVSDANGSGMNSPDLTVELHSKASATDQLLVPSQPAAADAARFYQARSLQPALQMLPGCMPVRGGEVVSVRSRHNTVAISFELEEACYQYLLQRDAAFPQQHFEMAADTGDLGFSYNI